MSGEQLRLQLELDRKSDPIEGRLTTQQGRTITFTGWLELMSALEHARDFETCLTDEDDDPPSQQQD
jgi:hypothetical protein